MKLIVFDVDGTLLDSHGYFHGLVKTYSDARGMPHPCIDTIQRGYGDPLNHDFKWGVPREEQFNHLRAVWQMEDDACTVTAPHLYDGVPDMLRQLKNMGHTLALITSKSEKPLVSYFTRHGIMDMFSAVRVQDDIRRRGEKEKPAPDMLHSVMRELGFKAGDTAMVGDTIMDMRMARGADTYALGVDWGAHAPHVLREAGAHHVLEKEISTLLPALGKIFP